MENTSSLDPSSSLNPNPLPPRGRVGWGPEMMVDPWPLRRQRTDELASRYPHAAQILGLYRALLEPQAEAFHAIFSPSPFGGGQGGGGGSQFDIAAFAVQRVLPGIIDATVEAGPPLLRDGVVALFASADMEDLVRRWLAGDPLPPADTYLARACTAPLLEAIAQSPSHVAGEGQGGGSPRHCPACGGLPQLSYFAISGEALVTGPRYLVCSRCATNWIYTRLVCAGCGETSGRRLPIYGEAERFPHIRVDGCETCHQYLLNFDLRKDSRAVPIVDELAALPLDLYAQEHGLTKIVPNLVGN
jgi:FdhE protein